LAGRSVLTTRYLPNLQVLPSGVAGVQLVPKLNVFLVLLPTEKHFFAADKCWKVDQTAIQVFNLNFAALKFLESFFDIRDRSQPDVDGFPAEVAPGLG
jgi:hypothetical protein